MKDNYENYAFLQEEFWEKEEKERIEWGDAVFSFLISWNLHLNFFLYKRFDFWFFSRAILKLKS